VAVHDPDLLNLLLAYSACHRARLLAHPEPKVRILRYVTNVFSRLAEAFRSPEIVSEKHVATAIMLCSLEIVSPQAFEHRIPWYTYLNMARDMYKQRSDARAWQTTNSADMYFLCRWYGYLDIMGSMSGVYRPEPLDFDVYWITNIDEPDDTIDCLLGCTMHCMRLLGEVAKLIKECQHTRFDAAQDKVRLRWQPLESHASRARTLIDNLRESSQLRVTTCPHEALNSPRPLEAPHSTDLKELMSVNVIYHWAGIIQLHRRVLNTPQDSEEVIFAIDKVLELLGTMRAGSPAEACMLFPIFSAGCEARDNERIGAFRRRTGDISRLGMRQASLSQ
jgi:Fungal specific transcription factor domain